MNTLPSWELIFIDSQEGLSKHSKALSLEEVLPIDTETAGWQTGNDYLCLLQIGLPTKKQILLIDALAIDDLEALKSVLEDEEVIKIAHNTSFERRILAKRGIELEGDIDTIDQAKLFRPDLPSYKLSTCVKANLDIEIGKELQTSDWSVRPLSQAQLEYAALDVEITYALYSQFSELEEQMDIDEDSSLAKLMKQLFETSKKRYELLEPIAKEYFFLEALEAELEEIITEKLSDKAKDFSSKFGDANTRVSKRMIVDPALVRKELPELADQIIEEKVHKTKFKAFLRQHGIEEDILSKVEKLSGEYKRVSIRVKDWLTNS